MFQERPRTESSRLPLLFSQGKHKRVQKQELLKQIQGKEFVKENSGMKTKNQTYLINYFQSISYLKNVGK